jgi:Tol biopolymer transport system component
MTRGEATVVALVLGSGPGAIASDSAGCSSVRCVWPGCIIAPTMALVKGSRLGPYEVLDALGAGGMGEVYRARDTKLGREVALKVLPEEFAADAERMGRFEREAKLLASLNHPNIATIHGMEESGEVRALVMELVPGQTLAELLMTSAGTPGRVMPLDEALPIAKQIADGLEFAHERGIVHRDLKPANVKVTPDGVVKILDFGLAKALEGDTTAKDPSSSPTMSRLATQAGIILGTASYMSPEQAKGKTVDRRADIWAFGCVLHEMLSGRKPFEGETVTDILAGVVRAEPDWTALPADVASRIRDLLRRCLEKDAKQRLRDIGEARITIEEVISGDTGASQEPARGEAAPGHDPSRRRAVAWAVAGLLAGALIASLLFWKFATSAPEMSPVLAYIPPPPNTTFRDFGFGAGPVVVSPDGKQLAFSATDENGVTKLWVRPLASDKAQAIAGTEDAASPFWSPDGRSLGFFADENLKTVNLANGNVQALADARCYGAGGAWSADGTVLFTPRCTGPLNRISPAGGKPVPATKIESGEIGQQTPAFLPDGRHFLYVSESPSDSSPSIWMGSLGSSDPKLVLEGASSPEFVDGDLLFTRDNRVFAQPFDPATGKLAGEARVLAQAQSYSASSEVLAFQGGTQSGRMEWFDRSGNPLGSVGPVAVYDSVRISPGGERILAEVDNPRGARILAEVDNPESNSSDLWSYPASGGVGTRLTFGPGRKSFPVWSPDGKYIAYECQPDGKQGICRKPANGSGAEERLFTFGNGMSRNIGGVIDWSPDGRYLSFNENVTKTSFTELSVLPLFGDRKPFQPAAVSASQYDGVFSPDGRWIEYFSYESGRPEVYVVPFPGPGGKFQISQNGGWNCAWDKKGNLYYMSMGNRLMEAELTTAGGSVQVKAIHPLFQLNIPSFKDRFFDVSADGSRFLVVTSPDPNASRTIGTLLNWQSKLKGNK